MQKTKKLLSILLSLLMITSTLSAVPFSAIADTNDDWDYEELEDGTICLGEYYGSSSDITIPDKVDGLTVSKINVTELTCTVSPAKYSVSGTNAYFSVSNGVLFNKNKTELIAYPTGSDRTSYDIPNTVKRIGESAFAYSFILENITIPGSVTSVGHDAFYDTKFYNNQDNWKDDVFYAGDCLADADYELSGKVKIKSGTRVIADGAFHGIDDLTGVEFPDSVTHIGNESFSSCESLSEVKFGSGLTHIGDDAFYECEALENVSFPASLKSIGSEAFSYCSALKSVSIPNSVTELGEYVFEMCTGLTSVTIGSGITEIPFNAFRWCENLESIIFTKNITKINESAFEYCDNISDIYFTGSQSDWDDIDIEYGNDFENADFHYNYGGGCIHSWSDGVVTKPATETENGVITYTCTICGETKTEVIPKTGASAEDFEYDLLSNGTIEITGYSGTIANVNIPSSIDGKTVSSIGESAFNCCDVLESVTIPDSVTRIQSYAFNGCENLRKVHNGSGLKTIGNRIFEDANVDEIFYNNTKSNWEKLINNKNLGIYLPYAVHCSDGDIVPAELLSGKCGNNATYEFDLSSATLTISGSGPMYSYNENNYPPYSSTLIKHIVINEGITAIGNMAFAGCSGATSITIPGSVTDFGDYAFDSCRDLKEMTVPCSFEFRDGNAFSNLNLERIVLTAGTGRMPDYDGDSLNRNDTPWHCCKSTVKEIIIEEGVTYIGEDAFYGLDGSTSVVIPDSVTSLGDYAFGSCSGVKELTMPCSLDISREEDSYTSVFYCNRLEKLTLTKGSGTMINYNYDFYLGFSGGFEYNKGPAWEDARETLKEVVFEDGIISIGNDSFSGFTALRKVTLPNSVKNLGKGTFYGCSVLTDIALPNSVTEIGLNVFRETGLKSITIPDSVTAIDNCAFSECLSLESVTIPNSVVSVGGSVFSDCSKLKDIYYNDVKGKFKYLTGTNDTGINNDTIIHCTDGNVTFAELCNENSGYCGENVQYSFDENSGVLRIFGSGEMADYYFNNAEGTSPFFNNQKIKKIVVESGVTGIGDYAFMWCSKVESVSLPNTVKTIGAHAFEDFHSLTSIDIPDSVEVIYAHAFRYCKNLKTIKLSSKLKVIGYGAFTHCLELESIAIPESVEIIDGNAFSECVSLTEFHLPKNVKKYGYHHKEYDSRNSYQYDDDDDDEDEEDDETQGTVLSESGNIAKITVDAGNTAYDSRNNCNAIINSKTNELIEGCNNTVIPDTVKSICGYAFYCCDELSSVNIPKGLTSIGMCAFCYCSGLNNITLPSGIEEIGAEAFYNTGYYNNKSNWEDNVLYINNYLIRANDNISGNYSIKSGTTLIAGEAFYSCRNLTGVTIPNTVVSIGYRAFQWCSKLTSVEIPFGVTEIGDAAFSQCNSLKSVTIPSSVTYLGNAFGYCSKLTTITIPDSITEISDGTFSNCSNLTSIVIPKSVTSIGDYAFGYCENLSDVYYTGSEDEWKTISIGQNNEELKGAAIHYNYVPVCEHNYVATVIAPTCTEKGYTAYTCTKCGDTKKDNFVNATGHKNAAAVRENEVAATCTATGSYDEVVYCSVCHAEISRTGKTIEKTAHSYTFVVTAPTCTEQGYTTYTCTVCGDTKKDNYVNATGHKNAAAVRENEVAATCTATGSYDEVIYCSVCNTEISRTSKTSEALGHVWNNGVETTPATEENEGVRTYTCTRCGETRTEVIPKLTHNHSFATTVTAPTCTKQGYTTYTCTTCGYSYDSDYVAALGHSAAAAVKENEVAATCTAAGSYDEVAYCSRCNDELSRTVKTVNALGHAWNSGVITTPATEDTEGVKTFTCTRCGATRTETIPMVSTKGFTYKVLSNGNAQITDYNGTESNITIPSTVDNHKVTSIGEYAFVNSKIISVVIPSSVTSIGDWSFYCCAKLTSVIIPNGVTHIGEGAFCDCESLTALTVPKSVSSIDDYAFSGCIGISSIIVDSENKTYDSRNNCNAIIETNTDTLIAGFKTTKIPNTVTSIGDRAFYDCKSLKSITIPNSVTSIGYYAFEYCDGLTTITIPKNVTDIGRDAFYSCAGLKSVTLQNSKVSIDGFSFCECDSLTDVYFSGTKSEWKSVSKGYVGADLLVEKVTIHFSDGIHNSSNHNWDKVKVKKQATFKAAGKITYTCTICGETKTSAIAKLGKPSLSKLTKGKKSFKATWKAVNNVGGYQIQYATNSKFTKGNKTVTVSGVSSKSKTVKKLKANSTYYVRIRAYKTINGKKQYSAWSKSKKVKTK